MISASQTEKGLSCLRRFLMDWRVPFADRPPKSPEALFGSDLHSVAQAYHQRGVEPDPLSLAGQMFGPARKYAPKPGIGRVEGEFHLTVSGVLYQGFIDLECMSDDLPGARKLGIPAVVDYKGKKTLSEPSILEGEGAFLNDPQALIYAARTLVKYKASEVYMRWIYVKRDGKPGAKPQDAILSRKEVTAAFGRLIHPTALVLVQLKQKKDLDPLRLPPSPASCMRYGPKWACPWIDTCNLTPDEKLAGLEDKKPTKESMMDLLAELEAMEDKSAQSVAASAATNEGRQPVINPPESKPAPKAEPTPNPVPVKYLVAVQGAPSDEEIGRVVRFLLGR
jgi:hypothetical protein